MLCLGPRLVSLWLLVAAVLTPRALAQGNDLSAPAGGRAALMGNTGVALGRDGSAPFYNPATIVRIRDQRLAFSVNFYSLGVTHFDDWHQPGAVDQAQFGDRNLAGTGLLKMGFRTLPDTLCLFFTLDQLAKVALGENADKHQPKPDPDDDRPPGKKLAICFATLESDDVDIQAIRFRAETSAGQTAQVQSLQRRWTRAYLGPTYSVSLSERLAIGAALQVAYTSTSFGVNSQSVTSQLSGGALASSLSTSGSGRSFELTGVIGATYRVDRLTLGASLRPPALHVYGSYTGTFSQAHGGDPDVSLIVDGSGSFRSAPPTRLALGAGYAWERGTLELNAALELPLQRSLAVSLDVTRSSLDDVTRKDSRERYAIDQQLTVNPSAGFEYFLTPSLSLLGGLSTNLTAIEPLVPVRSVGNLIQSRMNHVSASLGVGSYWSRGELLFGLQLDHGWGKALAVNPFVIPNDWSIVDTQQYSLLFVVAGATSLRSIARMVSSLANGGETDDAPAQDAQGVPRKSR